jgi:transposase InsO family protein
MNYEAAKDVANFRYRLIAPIVTRDNLLPGETAALIREAAAKTYLIPGSIKTKVGIRTLERYIRDYRRGGFEALMPQYRGSRKPRIVPEYLEQAMLLKKENPKRSCVQIIEILELAEKVPKGVLKRSTLYDHFEKHGLNRKFTVKETRIFQRFEAKYRNQRWQGDTCHLLYLPNPNANGKQQKVYLIVWLEEYSRMVVHGQCYFEEKLPSLEDCLKKALVKFGVPTQIYVDNGKIYSAKHLESICGRLRMQLSHTRPYKPQGRGKLERLFSTIQQSFLVEILDKMKTETITLEQLNDLFWVWLRQCYHEKVHSATKQRPRLRFESDPHPLRQVSLNIIQDAFLLETVRKVDKTGVISLDGFLYQVPLELMGQKVLLRYDPYDRSVLQVFCDDKRFPDATLLVVPERVNHQLSPLPVNDQVKPESGLNYLTLIEQKERQGLSYLGLENRGES